MTNDLIDVIIVGAGPVGLLLACELALAKLSVRVVEMAPDPISLLKRLPLGMRGITVPSAEAFYRRGLLDDIRGNQPIQNAGHFAGIDIHLEKVDFSKWNYRLPNPAYRNFGAEMERVESVLSGRAETLGVQIHRGLEFQDAEQSDAGVTVRAGGQAFLAKWLVGCDGGRSKVRKVSGFDFVGTEPSFTGYSSVVEIADPEKLVPGRNLGPGGVYLWGPPAVLALADFDGGAFHRSGEITLDHLQSVLRHVSGTDVTLRAVHQATSWTDRAKQTTTYRMGRVLLAGDAAHIHSPLGGQGLNTGLGDAMNLGWKLAATIRGTAVEGLLDTYTEERHPVGARVLDWSRAQVDIMRPSPNARAMESVMHDLMNTRDGSTYVAERVWSVCLRYDLGASHPLVGLSTPDFLFQNGSTVGSLMRQGTGLLLEFGSRSTLQQLAKAWSSRVKYVLDLPEERLGLKALLVRPDGVVAWACDEEFVDSNVEVAMTRWFGAPFLS